MDLAIDDELVFARPCPRDVRVVFPGEAAVAIALPDDDHIGVLLIGVRELGASERPHVDIALAISIGRQFHGGARLGAKYSGAEHNERHRKARRLPMRCSPF